MGDWDCQAQGCLDTGSYESIYEHENIYRAAFFLHLYTFVFLLFIDGLPFFCQCNPVKLNNQSQLYFLLFKGF